MITWSFYKTTFTSLEKFIFATWTNLLPSSSASSLKLRHSPSDSRSWYHVMLVNPVAQQTRSVTWSTHVISNVAGFGLSVKCRPANESPRKYIILNNSCWNLWTPSSKAEIIHQIDWCRLPFHDDSKLIQKHYIPVLIKSIKATMYVCMHTNFMHACMHTYKLTTLCMHAYKLYACMHTN